jgi:uncharacterized membrane protein YhaH (DUF805 family)
MNFFQAISICFKKYVDFKGRASRPEFWYFYLFEIIVALSLFIINEKLEWAFAVSTFLPYIAVAARRLHDIDKSGWWYLLGLVPIVGTIILIIWWCRRGDTSTNRFGDSKN